VDTFVLVVTIMVALFFTYTNGFHDSASALARRKRMPPRP
jgi:PiT family inorganic phosphate transporter